MIFVKLLLCFCFSRSLKGEFIASGLFGGGVTTPSLGTTGLDKFIGDQVYC